MMRLSYNFRILEHMGSILVEAGVQNKYFKAFLDDILKDNECSNLISKNFEKFSYTALLEFLSKIPHQMKKAVIHAVIACTFDTDPTSTYR